MQELSERIQSNVPGPVSKYGYSIRPENRRVVIYDGQFLPPFLMKEGADHRLSRQFLLENQIGSPFEELEAGIVVKLPASNPFLKHPDA